MASIPLISNFQGDFVLQLVAAETENTMDELAQVAARHSVSRRVPDRPGQILRVRRQGAAEPLPRDKRISEAGFKPMECIEIVWEDPSRH